MKEELIRTARLLGADALERLSHTRVAIFGVGGVGGYVAEALARVGVGAFDLIDKDRVSLSNINRQIIALHSTVGRPKVEAAKERILDINPDACVVAHEVFFLPESAGMFDFSSYDYVVDAVDNVTAKIALVLAARDAGVPIISSMGAGNKLDPSKFTVTDLAKTSVDPLARVMRTELRRRGILHLKVVWSPEIPTKPTVAPDEPDPKAPGSLSFVPATAGLLLASAVVADLIK